MKRAFAAPLALSVLGHCVALVLLLAFAAELPRLPPPPTPRAIEIVLPPPAPPAPAPAKPQPAPPVVKAAPPPQPKPPPVVKEKPPPPRVVKEKRPPPPPRPVVRHRLPPEMRREAPPPETRREAPPVREMYREPPPVRYQPPVQYAAPTPPPRPAAPVVTPGYRGALYAWIERHKYYPEQARERGEAGAAVLRFRVDRTGRVLDYSVVRSTGYPDLDAAISRMMAGAQLPPFPTDMTASSVEVSVTIRFALAQ